MFETFSERAKRVIFAARLAAGQRGAASMDVNDLIVGLITEDQGLTEEELAMTHGAFLPSRRKRDSFFSSNVGANILAKMKELLPQGLAIGSSADLSVSPELTSTFSLAKQVQLELHQSAVQPLHLLAAALVEGQSCLGALLLQEAGITHEKVRQLLDSGLTQ
jgi:ATP-dependent Clp protease ATP-binding subunit ClpC